MEPTAGWISISLGVTATPATVVVNRRGLTTMSCVETAAPVAESVTMHGRYESTAAEVVASCASCRGASSVRSESSAQVRMAECQHVGAGLAVLAHAA